MTSSAFDLDSRLEPSIFLKAYDLLLNLIDVDAFSDASSGTGLALLVGQEWKAWRLLPGWQSDGRDIAWAESIALELLANAVVTEHGQGRSYRLDTPC